MYKITIIVFFLSLYSVVATAADITCNMTASTNTPRTGEDVTYTIIVKNNGPSVANSVQTTTNLYNSSYKSHQVSQGSCKTGGSLRCNLGTIAAGQSADISVDVTITAAKRTFIVPTKVSGPDGRTSCTVRMSIN